MGATCFVPNCKSGYTSTVKRNKAAGLRNPSLFSAPEDKELLKKWRNKILRKDRYLTIRDFVCEKHFESELIVREEKIVSIDGGVYMLKRNHAMLAKGAIPTKFPDCPPYLSVPVLKRRETSRQAKCVVESTQRCINKRKEHESISEQELTNNVK